MLAFYVSIVTADDAFPLGPKDKRPTVVAQEQEAKVQLDLGIQLLKDKQYYAAAETFARAIQLRPEYPEAFVQWGVTLERMSHQTVSASDQYKLLKAAADKFDRAARLKPDDKTIFIQWADTLVIIGDLPLGRDIRYSCLLGAAEKYRMASDLTPDDWQGYMRWGIVLFTRLPNFAPDAPAREATLKRAAEVFSKAADHAVETREIVDTHLLWGNALTQAGQAAWDAGDKLVLFREAVDKYERAARADPKQASIYAMWGGALIELGKVSHVRGDFRDAIDKLNIVLEYKSDDIAAFYNMACAYSQMEDYDRALECLRKCFLLDAKNSYRKLARADSDLTRLRGDRRFEDLIKGRTTGVNVAPPPVRDSSK